MFGKLLPSQKLNTNTGGHKTNNSAPAKTPNLGRDSQTNDPKLLKAVTPMLVNDEFSPYKLNELKLLNAIKHY